MNSKKEVRKMTFEMRRQYDILMQAQSYAEVLKSRTFVRSKTICNAVFVSKLEDNKFWEIVTNTWKDTSGKNCIVEKGYTVRIG